MVAFTVYVVALTLSMCCLTLGSPRSSPPATHTLEDINHRLDMILNNTRSRENYIRCFMDRGICNKDALNIKRILSDALSTNCSNCTQSQRQGAERFFQYMKSNQPDTYTNLTTKYNSGGGGPAAVDSGKKDDDDDENDDDDEEEKKTGKQDPNHKHKHTHKHTPGKSEGSSAPSEATPAATPPSVVPANSTITMIF